MFNVAAAMGPATASRLLTTNPLNQHNSYTHYMFTMSKSNVNLKIDLGHITPQL